MSEQATGLRRKDGPLRFEATAYDIVGSRGGRVIKMIGDEVMFAVDDVATSLEIALSLAEGGAPQATMGPFFPARLPDHAATGL